MGFNRACLLAALGCSLGACAASEHYPSLAIRDVERVSGTMEPAEPEPYVPPPTPPAVLDRLDRLAADAADAHESFLAQVPQARSAVASGRGSGPGDDSWARAHLALADLEGSRSPATIALADLDRLHLEASLEGGSLDRIDAVRAQVAQQVGEQDLTIASLQADLPR
jgi:hypothetical protein